jgi:hypothetical protein
MKLRLFVPFIVGAMLMVRPCSAADEGFVGRLQGTFSSDQKTFVTIKRLTFTRDKEGKRMSLGSNDCCARSFQYVILYCNRASAHLGIDGSRI